MSVTWTFWCLVEGDQSPFTITVSPSIPIDELKKIIKAEKSRRLQNVDASDLAVWKVRYCKGFVLTLRLTPL